MRSQAEISQQTVKESTSIVRQYMGFEVDEADAQRLLDLFGPSSARLQRALKTIQQQNVNIAQYCEDYQLRPAIQQHLDNCEDIPIGEHEPLIQEWLSVTDSLTAGTSREDMDALQVYLPRLETALLETQKSYNEVMLCYCPFLKHSHYKIHYHVWLESLTATARQYYLAGDHLNAKLMAWDVLCFYQQQGDTPSSAVIRLLLNVSLLLGDLADAMLFASYGKMDKITIAMIQDCAVAAIVQNQSLCERQFGLTAPTVDNKKQQLAPLVKTLHHTGNRLWVLMFQEQDPPLKEYYGQLAIRCYEKVKLLTALISDSDLIIFKKLADIFLPQLKRQKPLPPPEQVRTGCEYLHLDLWPEHLRPLRQPSDLRSPYPHTTTIMVETLHALFALGESLLGASPWPYAIMGLGSLARGEACPYSDLEFAIVIQDSPSQAVKQETVRYLKALLLWMELQLIRLGETSKAMLWTSTLAHKKIELPITLGFRFDEGGNIPFSEKDRECFLVGTTADLLQQSFSAPSGSTIPGDVIIANSLQGAAYIGGEKSCADYFKQQLPLTLRQNDQHQKLALHLLQDHFENADFNVVLDEKTTELDIKKGFLRLPTFITETLALYYGINETSTRERLQALVKEGYISSVMASALQICITLGLTLRTQAHRHYRQEEDTVYFQSTSDKHYVLSDMDKTLLLTAFTAMTVPTKTLVKQFLGNKDDSIRPLTDASLYKTTMQNHPPHGVALREQLFELYARQDLLLVENYQHFLYETVLQHNPASAQEFSDRALALASQNNMSTALSCVRFLAKTNYKADPYYQKYFEHFTQWHEAFTRQELAPQEKQVLQERLMRLPRPDGMRPSILYQQHRWRAILESITEPVTPQSDGILLEGLELGKRVLKSEVAACFSHDKYRSGFGTHTVFDIPFGQPSLHIKFFPEYPGIEKAASRLINRVVGNHVQESELCQLTWPDGKRASILIMQTVPGKNIAHYYESEKKSPGPSRFEKKLRAIDGETFSRLFIAALLTTNEDGKPDNIMIHLRHALEDLWGKYPFKESYTLTLIDNERCFLPTMATVDGKIDLQMKHFVFCMSQMEDPIHPVVKAEIESLDPYRLLHGWLETLAQDNQRCKQVFGEATITQYAQLPEKGSWKGKVGETAQLLLTVLLAHLHESLFWKLHNLKSLWHKHPTITHRELLQRLERRASDIYDQAFQKASAQQEGSMAQWETIQEKYYTVKKGVAVSTLKNRTILSKTFDILDKQSLFALMNNPEHSHRCYTPDTSQNRLLHEFEVQQIQTECVNGNLTAFEQLRSSAQRQVLQTLDFKKLQGNTAIEQRLLTTLQSLHLKTLRIQSAASLTDNLLIDIIKNNLEYLTRVELIDCAQLTTRSISNLLYYCPQLESLRLIQLPGLEQVYGVNALGRKTTAVLSQLQSLKIKDCVALQSVTLELPVIQTCVMQGNVQLKNIFIQRNACQDLLKAASQKRYGDVQQAMKNNPGLIYAQGNARGRRFQQVSVLEYAEKTGDNELYESALAYFPDKVKLEATPPTLGTVRFARPPLPQDLSNPNTALRCLVGESFTNRKTVIQNLKTALNKNRGSDKTKALERCMIRELKVHYYAYHKQVWKPEPFFPTGLRTLFDELSLEKAVSLDFVAYIDEYLDYLAYEQKGQPPVVLMLGGFLDAIAELHGKHVYYWRGQNGQLCCIHEYSPKNTSDTALSQKDVLHILHQTTVFQRLTSHSQAGFIWASQLAPQFRGPLMRYEAFTLAWQLERVNRKKVRPLSTAGQDGRLFLPTPTAYDAVKAKAYSILHQVAPQDIQKILDAVGNGALDTVKSCLESNENLLYVVGDVTDVADRFFSEVTVFQYALWAGDIPMCKMILERLPLSDAVQQRLAFENDRVDIHAQHGRFFSFESTLRQYDKYIRNYERWSGQQCALHWQKGVGGNQLTWPAWVRYKFTEHGESVSWVQKNINMPYARNRDHEYIEWRTTTYGGHGWHRAGGRIRGDRYFVYDNMDHECLNNEQSAILEYRETLSRTQVHTTTEHTPIIGQAPRQ